MGSFKTVANEPNYNYHWVRDSVYLNIMIDSYTRDLLNRKIYFIENFSF